MCSSSRFASLHYFSTSFNPLCLSGTASTNFPVWPLSLVNSPRATRNLPSPTGTMPNEQSKSKDLPTGTTRGSILKFDELYQSCDRSVYIAITLVDKFFRGNQQVHIRLAGINSHCWWQTQSEFCSGDRECDSATVWIDLFVGGISS
jgi:hypothetical protein